ncbi:Unknown protein, partial [Striga hermonthica]
GYQERENSVRRSYCQPPVSQTREDSQMMTSKTSNNMMRRWSGQEYKSKIHSDGKCYYLSLASFKGQEDIKMCLDVGLKSMIDQLMQQVKHYSLETIVSNISAISEKFETRLVKLQNDLHMDFCKEIQT